MTGLHLSDGYVRICMNQNWVSWGLPVWDIYVRLTRSNVELEVYDVVSWVGINQIHPFKTMLQKRHRTRHYFSRIRL